MVVLLSVEDVTVVAEGHVVGLIDPGVRADRR